MLSLRLATLCAALVLGTAAAPAARAQTAPAQSTTLRGAYTLDASASDNVNAAINRAIARMNFITRPIARGRLRSTNAPYRRVTIDFTQDNVSITTDARAPIRTPANGTPLKWKREDGEMLDVSTEWENGRLEQTFKAPDGQRINAYALGADGRSMSMQVTVTSPRLPQPLRYTLVYRRAE